MGLEPRSCQDAKAPVIDDQHILAGDGFEDALKAALVSGTGPSGQSEGFEPARGALIEDGPPVTASLMAEGAGDPAACST